VTAFVGKFSLVSLATVSFYLRPAQSDQALACSNLAKNLVV
jgi:hypothetical protein